MSFNLTIEVQGEKQLSRSFTRFADKIKDFRPVFEAVGKVFNQILRDKFQNNDWKPLSPAYEAQKERRYPFQSILRASDKMFNALTKKDAQGNVHDVRELAATFGASGGQGRIAGFHQQGTRRMPQRKIIDLTEKNKKDMMRQAQRIMVGLAKDLGFSVESKSTFVQTEVGEI